MRHNSTYFYNIINIDVSNINIDKVNVAIILTECLFSKDLRQISNVTSKN